MSDLTFTRFARRLGRPVSAGRHARPVVARYSETLRKVLADANLRKRIEELGFLPVGNSRTEFAGYIQSELVAWAAIIRDNNIKLD